MPLYQYEPCNNPSCSQKEPFKAKNSMDNHKDPMPCPSCGQMCNRLSNDFCQNFQLKGFGWYRNGYNGASNGAGSK